MLDARRHQMFILFVMRSMERVHLLSPGDVIFNYAEEYFSNGLKPPIVHAWYHQYQTVSWIVFGYDFSITLFPQFLVSIPIMPLFTCETPKVSHGTNWKPSIVRFQQLGECTSIRWNATRQECGHRLERSGRSKSTTRLLPRVLRKVWLAGGCIFF